MALGDKNARLEMRLSKELRAAIIDDAKAKDEPLSTFVRSALMMQLRDHKAPTTEDIKLLQTSWRTLIGLGANINVIARNIQRAEIGQGTIPSSEYEETIALRKEINRVLNLAGKVIEKWL